jgi:hypothetical protein
MQRRAITQGTLAYDLFCRQFLQLKEADLTHRTAAACIYCGAQDGEPARQVSWRICSGAQRGCGEQELR